MTVSREALNVRVHQIGFPANVTGRHYGDGDPMGYMFNHPVYGEADLEKKAPFITGLDIIPGTFSVEHRTIS